MTERELFIAALRQPDGDARFVYVEGACADERLRAQVQSMLVEHEQLGGFLESPAFTPAVTADCGRALEGPGTIIGPYTLMEQIGEGGMGVVHVAEQSHPVRRRVALKVIKLGMDTRQVVARFEAERQALAMMDHPNIAKILDGGATESGRPYFVMELVHGLPITEYCDRERLTVRERLELFVLVCRAVQHAHQKGVIHRDLKPSNILVTLHDGVPVPKVIDFGVAKATGQGLADETIHTAFTQLVGTPLYMSPEQAELSGLDVDTRGDVYSLGVLLYELLTGTTPFDSRTLVKASFDEMRRIIREDEPPTPSTRLSTLGASLTSTSTNRSSDPRLLNRILRGELDWIVMKALEKDRARRYQTVNGFAADVLNHLTDRPVEACPPSASYRFRKFARRNRAPLVTAAMVAGALLVGAAASVWQAVRATHAEARADRQRDLAERSALEALRQRDESRRQKRVVLAREASLRRYFHAADVKLAWETSSHAWRRDDLNQARRLLARYEPGPGVDDVRGFAWHYLNDTLNPPNAQAPRATLLGHEGRVYHVDVSPDGKTLASAGEDGTAKLWDLPTGALRHTLRGHAGEVNCVAFAPDGTTLATASDDRTIRFWDPSDGREHAGRALTGFDLPVGRVVYSADGILLVAGELSELWDRAMTTLWDLASRARRVRIEGQFPLALSPDSKTLATTSRDCDVRLWDTADGRERALLHGHDGVVTTGAFSPDGGTLATSSRDSVRFWDLQGRQLGVRDWQGSVDYAVYSPDGRLLAADGGDGAVCLWETGGGPPRTILDGSAQRVRVVKFTPDGGTLATASDDGAVRLWDLSAAGRVKQPPDLPAPITALSFSADGALLATSIGEERSLLWDVRTGQARPLTRDRPDPDVTCVAFSPVDRLLAVTGLDQTVSLVDPITGTERLTIARLDSRLRVLAFSPDGELLVGGDDDGDFHVWETKTGRQARVVGPMEYALAPQTIAISPDGKTLAFRAPNTIAHRDLATGALGTLPLQPTDDVSCLAFSPDGRTLAAGVSDRRSLQLWGMSTGRVRATLVVGEGGARCLAFSPDGGTLASGSHRGEVILWDMATGQDLLRLVGHTGEVTLAAFSPDGRALATAGPSADGRRGELKFWRAAAAGSPGIQAKQE